MRAGGAEQNQWNAAGIDGGFMGDARLGRQERRREDVKCMRHGWRLRGRHRKVTQEHELHENGGERTRTEERGGGEVRPALAEAS